VLDGTCSDKAYDSATYVKYQSGNGGETIVYLLRTPVDLFVCFVNPGHPARDDDAYLGVYLDPANDGQQGLSDNFALLQPFSGAARAAYWNPTTNAYDGAALADWDVVSMGEPGRPGEEFSRYWRGAEFRVARANVGGWHHTIGLSVAYHYLDTATGERRYGWPSPDAPSNPDHWGNAEYPMPQLTIGRTDTAPTIDGTCHLTTEWAGANHVTFPIGAGFLGSAFVMHNNEDLFVCLVLREPAASTAGGPNAALFINRTGQGGQRPGADDMRFTIAYDGKVEANFGDGQGWAGPDPGGYTIARQILNEFGTKFWHAEYQISGATLGGDDWDRLINIAFAQQWLHYTGMIMVGPTSSGGGMSPTPGLWAI
jgi:hypothetical protein